jgi:ubiquitin-protein ligase
VSAFEERRAQDLQKLRELQRASRERVRVTHVSGNPPNKIDVELHLKTAPSKAYPQSIQEVTRVGISLPARYPFEEPTVNISTPILHPNVYTSGRVCLGVKWIPSFGLDLLVRRLAQIVTFDPTVLNLLSPANASAVSWYESAVRQHPSAFPSDRLDLAAAENPKTISWINMTAAAPGKVAIDCPHCAAKLALPSGRSGNVKCPKCGSSFRATT